MENVKLRLDYFLSLGLKLVDGDEFCMYSMNSYTVGDHGVVADHVNKPCSGDECRMITSFAPRKNTGKQPCDRLLPVIVTWESSGIDEDSRSLAKDFDWHETACKTVNIIDWTPDLDALIAMQIEHDAKIANKKSVDNIDAIVETTEEHWKPVEIEELIADVTCEETNDLEYWTSEEAQNYIAEKAAEFDQMNELLAMFNHIGGDPKMNKAKLMKLKEAGKLTKPVVGGV